MKGGFQLFFAPAYRRPPGAQPAGSGTVINRSKNDSLEQTKDQFEAYFTLDVDNSNYTTMGEKNVQKNYFGIKLIFMLS